MPLETGRRTERTPLIDSTCLEESLANKNVADITTGVSWGVAAFLLVNTALGAGMLNYPFAYNQIGGVLAAGLIQIVLLVFITSTMFILVYCADFNQDDTYHGVLMSMCGKRAQQLSALSILLTCYGINITFLVIIGDQYDRIFNSLLYDYLDEYWFLDRKFTIFMTSVLFIWPMCYAKRLDFLRHASILGMFAMLYVAFLTVYEHYKLDEATIVEMHKNTFGYTNMTTPNMTQVTPETMTAAQNSVRWVQSLVIIPVLCFAYQTHEVIVPVYACMKQRSIGHFMKASMFGLVILFFLYNLVGAYGYLTFGAHVDPDIMSLYDAKDPIVVVGIVALVIKFITTYPPLMFCGRGALDGLYGEFRRLSADEFRSSERPRRIVITTAWFFSTVALAIFAPDISVTLQLLGSMASINVFIFPGMCLISLTRRLRRARQAILLDEAYDFHTNELNQQRAKDYYMISGSYFSDLRKNAIRKAYNLDNSTGRQQFAATFASLIEFENNLPNKYGENSGINSTKPTSVTTTLSKNLPPSRLNGYGTQGMRLQRRQEEFEKIITNGSINQDYCNSIGRSINDSHNDYSDCDEPRNSRMKFDLLNNSSKLPTNNGFSNCDNANSTSTAMNHTYNGRVADDSELNISSNNKDPSIDRSAAFNTNNHMNSQHLNPYQQSLNNQSQRSGRRPCLQDSWNNRSTTGSILDRLQTSMAPSTVAQIGISRYAGFGLYTFSAMLIIFGTIIFVLELVSVFGYL